VFLSADENAARDKTAAADAAAAAAGTVMNWRRQLCFTRLHKTKSKRYCENRGNEVHLIYIYGSLMGAFTSSQDSMTRGAM